MRRRILTATTALILVLSLSATLAAPADASVHSVPNLPPFDLPGLVSWASSWLTALWDASDGDRGPDLDPDGNPISSDPLPTDPDIDDDRGPDLDPDG